MTLIHDANFAQIKALSPLRSSDRRKLADQIIADFGIATPAKLNDESTAEEKAAATAHFYRKFPSLRSLLPLMVPI